MGRALRGEQFNVDEVCIVHAVLRFVGRAFPAGIDEKTGRAFSFRKEWIRRRMESLASVFGVDVLTYAVMSNHMHVILRNRPDVVAQWSDEQVAIRWLRVFPDKRLEEHLAEPTDHDVQTLVNNRARMNQVRQRLSDISWFMRASAEPIARLANRQDECTGRFWEGRFKVQRIAVEAGLLACAMFDVDLNPIRASMTGSPDRSVHTSAYDRIEGQKGSEIESTAYELLSVVNEEVVRALQAIPISIRRSNRRVRLPGKKRKQVRRDAWLAPLTVSRKLSCDPEVSRSGLLVSDKRFLSLPWQAYIELLRWTGRQRGSGSA